MAEVELVEMIKTLHERLNELYAIDSNWRQWGAWPIDVTGSVLHKGATEEEIARQSESAAIHFRLPTAVSYSCIVLGSISGATLP